MSFCFFDFGPQVPEALGPLAEVVPDGLVEVGERRRAGGQQVPPKAVARRRRRRRRQGSRAESDEKSVGPFTNDVRNNLRTPFPLVHKITVTP